MENFKKIKVSLNTSYDIFIGRGILYKLKEYFEILGTPVRVLLVSDEYVYKLYGGAVEQIFRDLNISCTVFCVPQGEKSKSFENYISALRTAAKVGLTRADFVVALGGGVVGDLAGFVASTYQRGIGLVQIATSLLAMVDSSVGGKTGIDIPEGKNIVGTFYQPNIVICDISMLETLSEDFIIDGYAEVFKYALLFDRDFWNYLRIGKNFDYITIVSKCVEFKRDIVEQDEKESDIRTLLNLGHTIGHSIELASGFAISHGRAVAMGLAFMSFICAKDYGLSASMRDEIISTLLDFGYSLKLPCSAKNIADGIMVDKKRVSNSINLVLIKEISECYIKKVSVREFYEKILDYESEYNDLVGGK